jgi:hypothetical protein
MTSYLSHSIKNRTSPNDKFYTPIPLVETHINFIKDLIGEGVIFEPFAGEGAYVNNFSKFGLSNLVVFTEIEKGLDFFEFQEEVRYIISNPPYSMIDRVLEKSVQLKPQVISYLIGVGNLTAKRLEYMNNNGYYLERIKMCKVYKWYGMSFICVWVKGNGKDCISYDRVIYK